MDAAPQVVPAEHPGSTWRTARREWTSPLLALHAGAVLLTVLVPRGWLAERPDVVARVVLAVLSGLDRLLVLPWSHLVGARPLVLVLLNLGLHAGLLRLVRLMRHRAQRAETAVLRGGPTPTEAPLDGARPLAWPSGPDDAPAGPVGARRSPRAPGTRDAGAQRRVDRARSLLWLPLALWLLGTPICLWVAFVFWVSFGGAPRPSEDHLVALVGLLCAGACYLGAPVAGAALGRRAGSPRARAWYAVLLGLSCLPLLCLLVLVANA